MDNCEEVLKLLLEAVKGKELNNAVNRNSSEIPVGISNRHIHLSQKDLDSLFGENYGLTKIKDLSQPGQYACKEVVTICGPKGAIEKIRILGPVRSKTQVEVLAGDCIKLGAVSHVKLSGDLNRTSPITIVGPKGSVQLEEGLIVAQRHIHMTPEDAQNLGVHDGEIVSIKFEDLRGGIYNNVAVRANDASSLECHLDIEEANAMGINSKSKVTIVK
ncbi:phosphate propanoyltransferase [Clostridium botulinum]|uniref:Phosphate propanoyltransferase n=3 Tax=Clostridium botulinum TaxID=1491 RepID=A7GF41_CLOBL|nr:phosphate propanoyltransferase [Clostridium botulinum]ABS42099.1 propanediol utilization protein PduL homolog [Clostridium botulinum F str. Langeland]ACO86174.1 propanediol utilization protein PduL homolog [Clostridium botulinum A2 str. Kyoto]ADF99807.1 propanediol utilization protein PduL-like protein [Clostridium botulinum F str. 230613]APQ71562.1 propanediol utilization PduL family protein [Clostridium botulinum]AUN07240.1 phosphate propanoyltransferase [Clostridium botulinum]